MKKTMLVTIDYPPAVGGVAQYWKQVTESLPAAAFTVLTDGDVSMQDGKNIIRKKLLFSLLWPKWIRGIFVIWATSRQQGYRQILVGQLLPVGAMVWVLSYFADITYVVQVYGMDILQAGQSFRKKWLARGILSGASQILVNSKVVGEQLEKFLGREVPYVVVYPVPQRPAAADAVLIERLREQYHLEGKKIVLTVGRLVSRKGQDKVLAAMQSVWKTYQDTCYVVIGEGPERERLEELALPNMNRVFFLGKVSQQEREAWYELADLFVMTSRETPGDIEGFGMVYLEANWHGLPVVAGRSGGVAEAVIDDETGILVNPEAEDEIADALLRLLTDNAYAQKLGIQGKSRLETVLSWNESIEKLKAALS